MAKTDERKRKQYERREKDKRGEKGNKTTKFKTKKKPIKERVKKIQNSK